MTCKRLAVISSIIVVTVCSLSFVWPRYGYMLHRFLPPPPATALGADTPEQAKKLLEQVAHTINEQYVGKVPDSKRFVFGAAKGFVQALGDPHSEFLSPQEAVFLKQQMKGSFSGIGATLQESKFGLPEVVSVVPKSPASNAGIRAGDVALKIDGRSLEGLTLTEATMLIRGAEGTDVTIEVLRKGLANPLHISMKRQAMKLESDVKMRFDGNIAIIAVSHFGEKTYLEFVQAALAAKAHAEIAGVIIDLRNNPGGYVHVCGGMLAAWLSPYEPFIRMRSRKEESVLTGKKIGNMLFFDLTDKDKGNALSFDGIFDKMPTVVLMNRGSASASEIFAGALQDYKRAIVVGEQSYGKGSAQREFSLEGGSSLHLTVDQWSTPLGRIIDKSGITPDMNVALTEEDYLKKRDAQLKRALEFLRNGK
jgi:carboxyl-terminal processing protease